MYRLCAQSLKTEKSETVDEYRTPEDYNMIMIVIEDISRSETIFADAIRLFLTKLIGYFKWTILGLSCFVILALIILIMKWVQRYVVNPVEELSNTIIKPGRNIEKFIKDIKFEDELDQVR